MNSFICYEFIAGLIRYKWGFPGGPVVKNLPCNARDIGNDP